MRAHTHDYSHTHIVASEFQTGLSSKPRGPHVGPRLCHGTVYRKPQGKSSKVLPLATVRYWTTYPLTPTVLSTREQQLLLGIHHEDNVWILLAACFMLHYLLYTIHTQVCYQKTFSILLEIFLLKTTKFYHHNTPSQLHPISSQKHSYSQILLNNMLFSLKAVKYFKAHNNNRICQIIHLNLS